MKKLIISIAAVVALVGISSSTLASEEAGVYWGKWEQGKADGVVPPCGIDVSVLGGDAILQATVDTYCAIEPGKYESYINPAAIKVYNARGTDYPDGKTGVLVFKSIGVAFTTRHKDGQPVYDAISIKDGKSVASKKKGHPLNPETCNTCHNSFSGVCVGYVCGNR